MRVFSDAHDRVARLVIWMGVAGLPLLLAGSVLALGAFHAGRVAAAEAPEQPAPHDHALHAGRLGIDCRYCHQGADVASVAGLPSTQSCMSCHETIGAESAALAPVRASWKEGVPIAWARVHRVPPHTRFDHGAHARGGVSCEGCHGRVDQMDRVRQTAPLSMAWCLECHRRPAGRLSDRAAARDQGQLNPPLHCSGCHW